MEHKECKNCGAKYPERCVGCGENLFSKEEVKTQHDAECNGCGGVLCACGKTNCNCAMPQELSKCCGAMKVDVGIKPYGYEACGDCHKPFISTQKEDFLPTPAKSTEDKEEKELGNTEWD